MHASSAVVSIRSTPVNVRINSPRLGRSLWRSATWSNGPRERGSSAATRPDAWARRSRGSPVTRRPRTSIISGVSDACIGRDRATWSVVRGNGVPFGVTLSPRACRPPFFMEATLRKLRRRVERPESVSTSPLTVMKFAQTGHGNSEGSRPPRWRREARSAVTIRPRSFSIPTTTSSGSSVCSAAAPAARRAP